MIPTFHALVQLSNAMLREGDPYPFRLRYCGIDWEAVDYMAHEIGMESDTMQVSYYRWCMLDGITYACSWIGHGEHCCPDTATRQQHHERMTSFLSQQFSARLLAWCAEKLAEATHSPKESGT